MNNTESVNEESFDLADELLAVFDKHPADQTDEESAIAALDSAWSTISLITSGGGDYEFTDRQKKVIDGLINLLDDEINDLKSSGFFDSPQPTSTMENPMKNKEKQIDALLDDFTEYGSTLADHLGGTKIDYNGEPAAYFDGMKYAHSQILMSSLAFVEGNFQIQVKPHKHTNLWVEVLVTCGDDWNVDSDT